MATTKSRGQCIPRSKRLPITPVAQTNKNAMVKVRLRGHNRPTAKSAQLAAEHGVSGRETQSPVSFCQC
ncbi:Uncharacterised protein [Salmonella enterica subsp. enterica]|uniref:Uncharacterized protein n=1 Tax=Salmonella enterica I TaxID=59201 RepID=A0A447U2G1_SALET|nr:Uncharacterised protein [Salmonella enterica subsp. enterica]